VGLIPFIDAHVHFWDLKRLSYPWLTGPFEGSGPNGSVAAIASNYLPQNYRTDLVRWNVVGAVHIEAGADAGCAFDETGWLESLAKDAELPNGIVAYANLADAEIETVLAAQGRFSLVRGIRQIVNWHASSRYSYTDRDITLDPAWEVGFAGLAGHEMSFDLQCYPAQMKRIAAIAERHPDVPVIINHMGMPLLNEATGLEDWQDGMGVLAAMPQVAVKISGMGFISRGWKPDVWKSLISETIGRFGTERIMFASDAPTDKLFGSLDRYLDFYHSTVADFREADRRAMFGGNANRIYRLNLNDALDKAPGDSR
jgi:predicted TIM-barrel fold metal-dependent hydrolase